MKYVILTIVLMIANMQSSKAEGLKIEALAGYAHHYMEYKGYNDSTFNNNLTSDVALLKMSYNNVGILGLSDSQGNFSFAATYDIMLKKSNRYELKATLGAYFMRTDNEPTVFAPEVKSVLPTLNLGSREFTVLPLAGLQLDIHITNNLDFTTLVTPTFTLVGLKIKLK